MSNIINSMSAHARTNLKYNMHKVAAVMTKNQGIPLARDEITIKEAAYLMGFHMWKHRLEKRAMLEGLICARQLAR